MKRARGEVPELVCPACGSRFGPQERFCPDCKLPLVLDKSREADSERVSEKHERARKIKPQLAEGELVRVAGAQNQSEGEFIQGLLLEEGVPSMLRRSAGFDVPDFLAAGPRDVMVPISGFATARDPAPGRVDQLRPAHPAGRAGTTAGGAAGGTRARGAGGVAGEPRRALKRAPPRLLRTGQSRQMGAPGALGVDQRAASEGRGESRAGALRIQP